MQDSNHVLINFAQTVRDSSATWSFETPGGASEYHCRLPNTIGGFSGSADRRVSEDKTMREDQAVGSALEIKGPAKQVIGVGAVVVTLLALSLAMITIWAQMIIAL
jgi:hypothetical protein